MSQTTLTKFYNTRKRPATDEIVSSKNKIPHIDRTLDTSKTVQRNIHKGSSEAIKAIVKTVSEADSSSKRSVIPKDNAIEASTNKISSIVFSKKSNSTNVARNNLSKVDSVSSARKELSLGDIRKKLASSSRLSELITSADRISKGIKDLKDKTEKKNLKEFSSIDVAVPQSPSKINQIRKEFLSPNKDDVKVPTQRPLMSPRKVFVSPVKSPTKVPAYLRHASLLSSSSGPLPLPHHYRFLAEHFRGMETVVALLYNRNEKITFAKLKPSIQEMLKRTFSEKHLAQIKHLVPDFYNFDVQKIKSFNSSNKDAYELIISPNFPTDIKIMNPSVLLERRRYFYDTLLKEVKKHHAQFLSTLDPPIEIPDNKLVRWHPEFEIEKIPEIEGAKLPEIPNVDKMSSAQDVLAKARELFKCNTKMGRALEKLAQAQARGLTEQEKQVTGLKDTNHNISTQTSQPSTSNVTLINPALRNLPASLLEKVKAKQAAKAFEAMTRSSENEQKYVIFTRLPDLARTLRNIFVTERKNVLALNIILSKLDSSFKSHVSSTDLQRDIKMLTEIVPEWVRLHEIRNATYLKLDKITDLKIVMAKLEAEAAKYKIE